MTEKDDQTTPSTLTSRTGGVSTYKEMWGEAAAEPSMSVDEFYKLFPLYGDANNLLEILLAVLQPYQAADACRKPPPSSTQSSLPIRTTSGSKLSHCLRQSPTIPLFGRENMDELTWPLPGQPWIWGGT